MVKAVLKKGIKFLLFGGKGGVGKTTLATATALQAARQGKKVLVFSTDPVFSLSDSFEKKIGNKITTIQKNVYALEIDAESLLEDYRTEHGAIIKQIVDEGTYLDKEDISKFGKLSLPGLDELMALKKITDFLDEDEYDLYILDTAPTGHTIRLLALPDLMTDWINVLIEMHGKRDYIRKRLTGRSIEDEADRFTKKAKNDIKRVKDVLTDINKTQFDVITIPEAMSVYETRKFINILEKYKIPISHIIVNRVIQQNKCKFCIAKRKEQQRYIKQIKKEFSYDVIELPLFPSEVKGLKDLSIFGRVLYQGYPYKILKIRSIFTKSIARKSMMHDVLKEKKLKLLLFGGKGGVGKTTMAATTALEAAKHKKVLVFSTDPAHSLSDSFNCKIGDKITKIKKNVYALEIDAEKLFLQLKNEYRQEIKLFFKRIFRSSRQSGISLPLDEKIMSDIFDLSPPGVDELMALKKIIEFIDNEEYDLFILDTAPTGHTLRLLALPDDAIEWTKTLIQVKRKYPIGEDVGESLKDTLETIRRAKRTLTDPIKTEFVTVTIPEALGIYQTKRLIDNLDVLKIPVEHIIINKITQPNKCNLCLARNKQQQNYVKEINKKFSKYAITQMPWFKSEIKGLKSLNEVAEVLFR